MDFMLVVLPLIQISPSMWLVRNGTKCRGFGGIRLKDYPGRWWVSRQRMDVNLGKFGYKYTQIRDLPVLGMC